MRSGHGLIRKAHTTHISVCLYLEQVSIFSTITSFKSCQFHTPPILDKGATPRSIVEIHSAEAYFINTTFECMNTGVYYQACPWDIDHDSNQALYVCK